MCIYVCAARAQVANHSSKQCADNGLTNAKVIYLVSFQRVLVSWARQETTVTLTVAPVAGSCPLWHRPADRMIASGPIPLSAAGANWYWWCSVPFSNSRHKKAAWLNVFSERLQGRGLVNAIEVFYSLMFAFIISRLTLRRGLGCARVCWMPLTMVTLKGPNCQAPTEEFTQEWPAVQLQDPPTPVMGLAVAEVRYSSSRCCFLITSLK